LEGHEVDAVVDVGFAGSGALGIGHVWFPVSNGAEMAEYVVEKI
jgi:hypothetical protein